jgi:hypothetical protein
MSMAETFARRRFIAPRALARWAMCSCLLAAILFCDANTQAGLLGVIVGRAAANPKSEESGEEAKTEVLAPCSRSARASSTKVRLAKVAAHAGPAKNDTPRSRAGGSSAYQTLKHLFRDTSPSPLRC